MHGRGVFSINPYPMTEIDADERLRRIENIVHLPRGVGVVG